MASATPDLQLPSQPQGITAHWMIPNYTAWWQRHMCVNNLHSIAERGQDSNSWPIDRKSSILITRPPSHTESFDISLDITFHHAYTVFVWLGGQVNRELWPCNQQVVGSNRSCCIAECNSRQVVYTCASVTKQSNLEPANGWWCSEAGEITAGLVESNGSLSPGWWLQSLAG